MSSTQLPPTELRFDIPAELQVPGSAAAGAPARIRRIGPSFFEASCEEGFATGQRLWLLQGGRRIAVDVTAAPNSQADFYTLTMVEDKSGVVRADRRAPVDVAATLHIAGETEAIRVRVSDMSPSGMGIELGKALPLGARVCVSFTAGMAFGEVRFCKEKAPGSFLIGFRLEEYIG